MPLQTGVQYGPSDPPATGGARGILVVNNATGTLWLCKGGTYINITGATSANTPGVPLGPGGTPSSGGVLPPGTPVVTVLPSAGDPLAVIGQYVIFQGKAYIYTAGVFGGPDYWALDTTGSPSISDTFANLSLYPAAAHPVGTVFFATDYLVSYAVQEPAGVKTWIYYNGIYGAPIASIPVGLDDASRGFVFRASDYLHSWIWDGSAWSLTTGGLPPGTMLFANPGPPFGGFGQLWHLCDGATVDVSQNDATLVATVLPTIANTWFVR